MAQINIKIDTFDSACLPGLLEKEILKVEKAASNSPASDFSAYLSQLLESLAAVRAAREAYITGAS